MKELTIISGKGGTGKTTLCAAFASLARGKVLTDCDVRHREDFIGGRSYRIDWDLCSECGDCKAACRFDAIYFENGYVIDSLACEQCGLCALVCPDEAIAIKDAINGEWFISDTPFGKLVHAKLGIGEDNSSLIINDGPPGIGCPVTAAITGVDSVLIVTEPTLSGIHDLERVSQLCKHFDIPVLLCINKHDINPINSELIRAYCVANSISLVGEIPFEAAITVRCLG